jgi:hypothetical protein
MWWMVTAAGKKPTIRTMIVTTCHNAHRYNNNIERERERDIEMKKKQQRLESN